MKATFFKIWALLFGLSAIVTSCSKDENNNPSNDPIPMVIQADNNWNDSTINVNETVWYKITGADAFNTLYVEWADADSSGTSKLYTGDIKVSAYMLNGITPYFENVSKGFKDKKQEISLATEKEVLVKVELNDPTSPGTFSIRSTGVSNGRCLDSRYNRSRTNNRLFC
jgi:hypothetical protein